MSGELQAPRCAVHASRPAVDACPVCGRARCAADAAQHGAAGCAAPVHAATARGPDVPPLERLVRGALAGLGAGVLGGVVAAQYVDAELLGYLTPVVVGAGCGAAAQAAAGTVRGPDRGRGPTALRVRAVAALCAVLAVGLGLLLEGSSAPLSSGAVVPALLAAAGALLWTVPPRRRPAG